MNKKDWLGILGLAFIADQTMKKREADEEYQRGIDEANMEHLASLITGEDDDLDVYP